MNDDELADADAKPWRKALAAKDREIAEKNAALENYWGIISDLRDNDSRRLVLLHEAMEYFVATESCNELCARIEREIRKSQAQQEGR